ncbi:serine acetyltransferase [Luteimonas mephitis]|uniref:serine acetyltransferase n=1 Tax=Luteimonas mephitis TaxID=83615 RepID=UPI003A909738
MAHTTADPTTQWIEAFARHLDAGIPSIIEIHRHAQLHLQAGDEAAARRCERLIYLLHNSQVPAQCKLPRDTRFAYGGIGVVLHAAARFGNGVMIGQNVTIGGNGGKGKPDASGRSFAIPRIGNHVYIAAGARVLGGISIGDYTIIASNAVVLHDVPPFSVVAGNPANVRRTIGLDNALRYKDFFVFGKKKDEASYLDFIQTELARLT